MAGLPLRIDIWNNSGIVFRYLIEVLLYWPQLLKYKFTF